MAAARIRQPTADGRGTLRTGPSRAGRLQGWSWTGTDWSGTATGLELDGYRLERVGYRAGWGGAGTGLELDGYGLERGGYRAGAGRVRTGAGQLQARSDT